MVRRSEDAANRLEDKCSLARLIVPMGLMTPTWFIRDKKWVGEEAPAKVPGGGAALLVVEIGRPVELERRPVSKG